VQIQTLVDFKMEKSYHFAVIIWEQTLLKYKLYTARYPIALGGGDFFLLNI